MSRDQRRRLLRQLRDASFTVAGGGVTTPLDIGPPVRGLSHADWPALEARMLAEWNQHRDTLMAECPAGPRPWAYFWFDRPRADTIPSPQRDALLAEGRLTQTEADMMAGSHARHAYARIAASRPGETTSDWLADPQLIEKSIALVGWNPFTEDAIAYLRAREQERRGAALRHDRLTEGDSDAR